jgi:hypothetical protein
MCSNTSGEKAMSLDPSCTSWPAKRPPKSSRYDACYVLASIVVGKVLVTLQCSYPARSLQCADGRLPIRSLPDKPRGSFNPCAVPNALLPG